MNEVMTYSSFWQRAPSKSALHLHVKLKACVEFGVGLGVLGVRLGARLAP